MNSYCPDCAKVQAKVPEATCTKCASRDILDTKQTWLQEQTEKFSSQDQLIGRLHLAAEILELIGHREKLYTSPGEIIKDIQDICFSTISEKP